MWPFFKTKKKSNKDYSRFGLISDTDFTDTEPLDDPPRRPLLLQQLVEDMGDMADLCENDVALKFWLPEPVDEATKELKDLFDITLSRMLRQFLITHCYGIYAYEWLKDKYPDKFIEGFGSARFSRRPSKEPVKIRVTTYWVPELGKNIRAIKLWIPSRLKEDLTILAQHAGLSTSNYVREIVISRTLGHGTLPMRPEMMQYKSTSQAEDWNEDREVPWREISEELYDGNDAIKVVTTDSSE
ncbi:MAG: hypothetical protein HOM14_10225 [Gammaproteobacteria bacterium]|jgi:hypothetical protein|nr:hypothetical protein [Gammaproteobacteria bacterium]MBT4196844.1 hypothetical protein [Gammaproteobacteria bacterium]MBT4450020.1 hypothetical protein [Gammaproteobacteria bacterium]MBT4861904.1 hypothetical protein [Gammaproteobacteria bacterium]MBT6551718.1 hypothetical protein [Gammaproteobacteria bacterium]